MLVLGFLFCKGSTFEYSAFRFVKLLSYKSSALSHLACELAAFTQAHMKTYVFYAASQVGILFIAASAYFSIFLRYWKCEPSTSEKKPSYFVVSSRYLST